MPQNKFQGKDQQEESSLLRQRPRRSAQRYGPSALLLLVGGVVIILVVVFAFLRPGASSTNSVGTTANASATAGTNSGTSQTKGSSDLPGEGDLQVYWDTIRTQVSQGLHLDVVSLTNTLKPPTVTSKGAAPSGTTIGTVATQQNVSLSQLHTLELNAIQQACNTLVSQGSLTQQAASQRMQTVHSWNQESLDGYIMYAFQNH